MANRQNLKNRINNGVWMECLPPDFTISEIENIGSWSTMGAVAKSSHNSFKIINGLDAEPESLNQINSYLNKLEDWVEKYSDDFTYPPSKKGWESAIKKTMEKESLEDFAMLYGIFHKEIYNFYIENKDTDDLVNIQNSNSMKMLKNIFVVSQKNKKENDKDKDKVEEVLLTSTSESHKNNIYNQNAEDHKNEIKEKVPERDQIIENQEVKKHFIKKDELIDKEMDKFNVFYDESIKMDFDPTLKSFLLKRHIESRIKDAFDNIEGPEKSLNEWMKNTFLLSISRLEREKVKFIVNHWPEWSGLQKDAKPLNGRIDNEKLLGETAFWHSIKSINEILKQDNDDETTKNLYQKVIPNIVNIFDSNINEKVTIGKNILSWATKNEKEFVNRLNLWTKMGGNITETTKDNESIVSWIASQKNDMWDRVIVNFAKDKNINLNKFYPSHFKPKNSIHIAKDTSMANKLSPF